MFSRLVNPLGVHPEVMCFLLDCSSKIFFTGNYCSKLSVKLISAIYNHNADVLYERPLRLPLPGTEHVILAGGSAT